MTADPTSAGTSSIVIGRNVFPAHSTNQPSDSASLMRHSYINAYAVLCILTLVLVVEERAELEDAIAVWPLDYFLFGRALQVAVIKFEFELLPGEDTLSELVDPNALEKAVEVETHGSVYSGPYSSKKILKMSNSRVSANIGGRADTTNEDPHSGGSRSEASDDVDLRADEVGPNESGDEDVVRHLQKREAPFGEALS